MLCRMASACCKAVSTVCSIAHELDLSINTVKSHIRRHPGMKNAVFCLQCGRAVPQTPGRKQKKFCSNTCRSRYWNYQYRKGGRDGKNK